jgi:hypothetical protein
VLLTKCFSGDKIKKNEIGWLFGTYGDGRSAWRVWWGYQIEEVHLEDMDVDR